MASRKKATSSKITTLYVSFWGPFGFCIYNTIGSYEGVEVYAPRLNEGTHRYLIGDTPNIDPTLPPPDEFQSLLPDVSGSPLSGVEHGNYVNEPDDALMLLLDAEDADVNIKYVNNMRNSIWLPAPSAIIPNQLYSSNRIFDEKTGAAKRINKRQRYLPNVVSFVYSASNGQPQFSLGTYSWKPPTGTSAAQIHFLIGPKDKEIIDDSPEEDFKVLAALFPDLDLSVTKFPDTIYAQYAREVLPKSVHPPYACRSTSMLIVNPTFEPTNKRRLNSEKRTRTRS